MAKLHFVGGKMDGQALELKEGKQVIGNRRTAEIAVRESWISWDHAAIHGEGGKWFVEDVGSKGGTFLNGTKIGAKTELKEGDKLAFGTAPNESVCNFHVTGGPAAAAAPAAAAPAAKPAPAPTTTATAAAATVATATAASSAELDALRDKLQRAEIDLKNAVRDIKSRDGEIDKLKKEVDAAKAAGGGSGATSSEETKALEKALEEQAKIIEEKDSMIAALEAEKLDLQTGGAMGAVAAAGGIEAGGASAAELDALKVALGEAEASAKESKRELTKLEKQVERKDQEIDRLKDAAALGGGGGAGDAMGGGDPDSADIGSLKSELLDKNAQLDQLQSENLEFKDSVEKLSNRLRDINEKERNKKTSLEAQMGAMEEKVGEYLEAKHSAEKELERFKKEYSEFEERVIELQAQVDDLTERNDLMAYKLEQADTQVGELVRAKVADLQSKFDETNQANQQLKSLIDALEEKVSELDARAEELEAENGEIEKLLDEERKTHETTKTDGEKLVRALKKRLQLAAAGDKGALKETAESAAE